MGTELASDVGIDKRIEELHLSDCPLCGGPGPVDMHFSYHVVSIVVITRWSTKRQISCSNCARSAQWNALASSAALGWWGFPFGLILTPVQIGRNLYGIVNPPDSTRPSRRFREMVLASAAQSLRWSSSQMCPHCGAAYVPSDYREDATQILCRSCNRELPLPAQASKTSA